ncbi:unnamed protein product [Pleuronectes platessa]|uniref:ZP domain-containing protein n=1 Tax=Pleuronectes platessa TaxID=8262 RepID=A0A9N7Z5Z3_PLEPL|nr:unnamed protein product [Pleuronectes platessa]
MNLLSLFFLVSTVAKSHQLTCQNELRRPEYSDISVECGTSSISLAILICPVVYTGYNESLLILNHIFNMPECKGTLDDSVTPPVVRFTFPLNMTNACGSKFLTSSAAGTGMFADFSNIQTVNVSGAVRSHDPTTGVVTYNAELKYYYSCAYPLEYLINNTQDINYTTPLDIPPLGLELRTTIFVQVQADNLTAQYHVLLDRCYASISPNPTNSTFFNLFVPCSSDQMTTVYGNGNGHQSRFSFPAFRFIEQQNQTVSTYYLHCITRLCEISTCSGFQQCNSRRRRDVDPTDASEATILSSIPIVTKNDKSVSGTKSDSDSRIGLGIAVGVLTLAVIVVVAAAAIFYRRNRVF